MNDDFHSARELWDEASSAASEQRNRMREDMRFSNPTDPDQWDMKMRQARDLDSRPSYVFDQTNQYIAQVVNDARKNKPQIETVPANSGADEKVSTALDGMIRQIEYVSSASMAYDTALEHAARVGLGWFRIVPKLVNGSRNEQEIRILRVHDPLMVQFDPNFTSPDGSDQTFGFVETILPTAIFQRMYPDRKKDYANWQDKGGDWFSSDTVRIVEFFKQEEKKKSRLRISDIDKDKTPDGRLELTEDEYWEVDRKTNVRLKVHSQWMESEKVVKWYKLDGNDFLEEGTEFPSKYIPLIPVMGYESWIEGKRMLCGMVRRMMPGQRAYNIERNAELEWMAKQPKSPWVTPWEAVANHQREWASANSSDQAYLPYDHLDAQGNPLPPPQRAGAPATSQAFGLLSQKGLSDIQASIGMYRANLGAPSNETSGIAIRRREEQGDTANFHYIDNLARGLTQAGRVIVDMIPRLYDTKRAVQILGMDGKAETITINPRLGKPFKQDGKKTVEINLSTGDYDVRCKVGPAYTSLREEMAENLTRIVSSSPQLMTVLGPMWARSQDWPEAEHVSKLLLAMAPPPVQAIENDDAEIPPAALMKIQQQNQALQQAQAQLQQMSQMLQQAAQAAQQGQADTLKAQTDAQFKQAQIQIDQEKIAIDRFNAETDRIKVMGTAVTPEAIQQLVAETTLALNAPAEPVQDPVLVAVAGLQELLAANQQQLASMAAVLAAPKVAAKDPVTGAWTVAPVAPSV